MRKLWTLAATLLLAGSVALAQGGTTSPSPSPTAGQSTIIRGCLKGSNGDYRLSSSGSTYHLTGNTGDLAANVDKTVEITGTNVSDQAAAGGQQPNQMDFDVQSVSMISDKCESNVGQTSDTQGMTSAQQSSSEAGATSSSTQPTNPSTLQSPNPGATSTPDNTNTVPNTTTQPQDQSSLGTGTAGTTASTGSGADRSSQSSASQPSSTTASTSDMNAAGTSSQSSAASMNSPTESATASNNPNEGATGAATSASPSTASSGTSATENAQGIETAQADQGKKNGALPQTASPLPFLGLLGFGSLGAGLIARFRK